MKSFLSLLVFLVSCAIVQAGQVSWMNDPLAGSLISTVTPGSGDIADYMAYLCVGNEEVAQSTVTSLLNGEGWTGDKAIDSKNLSSAGGNNDSGYIDSPSASNIPGLPAGLTPFYVVLIDPTGRYFMVSSVLTGDVLDLEVGPGQVPVLQWAATAMDDLSGDSGWVAMGGTPVDPNVPEPTALALLALGVAGVALRRRVA